MNNYYWNKRNVSLDKDEIAPWKLPREKHATISVLLPRENELQTVDDYLTTCEELYDVDYKKRLNGLTTEAWDKTLNRLHARYNKRKNNKVLECLQFGGNKEFWDGFQSKNEILKEVKTADKVLFTDYAEEWLKIKEQTTKPSTYKEYERSYRVDLSPTFTKRTLSDITRSDLQTYLFGIIKEGKHRKAEKLALMLNCIFDMAAEDYDITSPMKKVVLPNYQGKSGQALTKNEEERLVKYCLSHKDVEGTEALLVLLFFGLRKSELKSLRIIDDKWLECETSKERLGQNVVLRKIPFTPAAKKVIPYIDFEKAKNANLNTVATRMKRLLSDHHPHELRHTFITRCKECGVQSEVVSIWAGHSLSGTITTTVYTHYSDEFQLKEAEKVNYR